MAFEARAATIGVPELGHWVGAGTDGGAEEVDELLVGAAKVAGCFSMATRGKGSCMGIHHGHIICSCCSAICCQASCCCHRAAGVVAEGAGVEVAVAGEAEENSCKGSSPAGSIPPAAGSSAIGCTGGGPGRSSRIRAALRITERIQQIRSRARQAARRSFNHSPQRMKSQHRLSH